MRTVTTPCDEVLGHLLVFVSPVDERCFQGHVLRHLPNTLVLNLYELFDAITISHQILTRGTERGRGRESTYTPQLWIHKLPGPFANCMYKVPQAQTVKRTAKLEMKNFHPWILQTLVLLYSTWSTPRLTIPTRFILLNEFIFIQLRFKVWNTECETTMLTCVGTQKGCIITDTKILENPATLLVKRVFTLRPISCWEKTTRTCVVLTSYISFQTKFLTQETLPLAIMPFELFSLVSNWVAIPRDERQSCRHVWTIRNFADTLGIPQGCEWQTTNSKHLSLIWWALSGKQQRNCRCAEIETCIDGWEWIRTTKRASKRTLNSRYEVHVRTHPMSQLQHNFWTNEENVIWTHRRILCTVITQKCLNILHKHTPHTSNWKLSLGPKCTVRRRITTVALRRSGNSCNKVQVYRFR